MKKETILTLTLTLTLTFSALSSHADIPRVMNFQGKATDTNGNPLNSDATHVYNLTFRIYNHETQGAPADALWTEAHNNVTITNGIFQVALGSVTALDLAFNEDYWISVEVNTDGEMSPRTRLASVGYAYTAEEATHAETATIISIPFYIQGLELECEASQSIKVTPGAVDIDGQVLTAAPYSSSIDITDDANYITGHNNPNPWIYVYLYDNNNEIAYKLADVPPDKADHEGHTDGTKRYYIEGDIAYRCIGAVKKENGQVARFFQHGNIVMWDVPINITTTVSAGTWSAAVGCSSGMPSLSTLGIFGLYAGCDTYHDNSMIAIRPNGSTWATNASNAIYGKINYTIDIGGQRWCATDSSQQIQYYNHAETDATRIDVEGYVLDR